MKISVEPVPPPQKALVQPMGEYLGLVTGLRAEHSSRQYRCGQCGQMQRAGSEMVWVPDGIRKSDPEWSVEERCRESAYNGHFGAWCLSCAPKKPKPKTGKSEKGLESVAEWIARPKPWWMIF